MSGFKCKSSLIGGVHSLLESAEGSCRAIKRARESAERKCRLLKLSTLCVSLEVWNPHADCRDRTRHHGVTDTAIIVDKRRKIFAFSALHALVRTMSGYSREDVRISSQRRAPGVRQIWAFRAALHAFAYYSGCPDIVRGCPDIVRGCPDINGALLE